ncbi:hypothetical protein ACWCV9_00375 [Streptomyces sp. NPDC001606]
MLALCACTGGGSDAKNPQPSASASTAALPAVPGIKTLKVPALRCKDPKHGTGTEEVITPDLKVVTTDSDRDAPGDAELYDQRLMLYKGNSCRDDVNDTWSTLDFAEDTKGLVGSIPANDNECIAAARNQNWDSNFDQDVRNLDGKTVCVLDFGKTFAVSIAVDRESSNDPHLPSLELHVKLY